MNKKKIFNDPIYGFIHISSELVFDIIEHPYFQRLRRIKQLGVTDFVYPGANHTRFHHALGAMYLMDRALKIIQNKGVEISPEEHEGCLLAILLHDVGHAPFSHSLEYSFFKNISHEKIGVWMMEKVNQEMGGKLSLALEIIQQKYPRTFFYQLISGQLDIDRLDYLKRDSFFTGVYEGMIGSERIIHLLNVVDDELVIEKKGIYSIEHFLNARRLMYWQVYLHKATVSAEVMLNQIIRRSKQLLRSNHSLISSDPLLFFLKKDIGEREFLENPEILKYFAQLDDHDIVGALKFWQHEKDTVLRELSKMLLNRHLFKTIFSKEKFDKAKIELLTEKISKKYKIDRKESNFFIQKGAVSNAAYDDSEKSIRVLESDGSIVKLTQATDLPNIKAISSLVEKQYLSFPKAILTE